MLPGCQDIIRFPPGALYSNPTQFIRREQVLRLKIIKLFEHARLWLRKIIVFRRAQFKLYLITSTDAGSRMLLNLLHLDKIENWTFICFDFRNEILKRAPTMAVRRLKGLFMLRYAHYVFNGMDCFCHNQLSLGPLPSKTMRKVWQKDIQMIIDVQIWTL